MGPYEADAENIVKKIKMLEEWAREAALHNATNAEMEIIENLAKEIYSSKFYAEDKKTVSDLLEEKGEWF